VPVEHVGQEMLEPTAEANEESIDEVSVTGIIVSDVYYKGIAISQLFVEPFVDVLGEPLSIHEAFFSYDGLEIVGDRGDLIGFFNMAIQLVGWAPKLSLFDINGVALDMTRVEIITALGVPFEFHSDNSISYHVLSNEINYVMTARFENPDDKTAISSINIFRMFEQP
jgi:hypothetical protein